MHSVYVYMTLLGKLILMQYIAVGTYVGGSHVEK